MISKASISEMGNFLLLHGWKRFDRPHPWCWSKPKSSGAFYTIQDAYDLEKSETK